MSIDKVVEIKCRGADRLPLESLKDFQGDLKTLSKENYRKLKEEILRHGFSEPVSVWKTEDSFYILNGHQRVRTLSMMKADGYLVPDLPVSYVEAKSKKEAKEKVLALTSQFGEITESGLSNFSIDAGIDLEFLNSLRFPEIDFDKFKDEHLNLRDVDDGSEDEVPEVPATPISKLGDIYELGSHRLLCGDSTSIDAVEMLMNGEKAEITFTSPPYNLKNNAKLRGYNGDGDDSVYIEKSDHKSQEDYLDFMIKWTVAAMKFSKVVFCNVQLLAGNKLAIPKYWMKFHDNLVDLMIWDKEHAQPAAAQRVLNSVFEMIFIFTDEQEPKRSIKTGPGFRGTIQNIFRLNPVRGGKDEFQKDHGAVFPVAFAEFFIKTFSSESVLDVFGGSGTTMIVAQKQNKKCFMMELDPHYIDVIVSRWVKYTGQTKIKKNGVEIEWST